MQMQSNAEGEIQLEVPSGCSFLSFFPRCLLCSLCFGGAVRTWQRSTPVMSLSLPTQVKSPRHDSHFNLDLKLHPVTPAAQRLPVLEINYADNEKLAVFGRIWLGLRHVWRGDSETFYFLESSCKCRWKWQGSTWTTWNASDHRLNIALSFNRKEKKPLKDIWWITHE